MPGVFKFILNLNLKISEIRLTQQQVKMGSAGCVGQGLSTRLGFKFKYNI